MERDLPELRVLERLEVDGRERLAEPAPVARKLLAVDLRAPRDRDPRQRRAVHERAGDRDRELELAREVRDRIAEQHELAELAPVDADTQHHHAALRRALERLDPVRLLAIGDQAITLISVVAPVRDLYPIGDEERGLQADAELSDQPIVLASYACLEHRPQLAGAASTDRREEHADVVGVEPLAVVRDRDQRAARVAPHLDRDLGLEPVAVELAAHARVVRVLDQLAIRDAWVRVQALAEELQQPR